MYAFTETRNPMKTGRIRVICATFIFCITVMVMAEPVEQVLSEGWKASSEQVFPLPDSGDVFAVRARAGAVGGRVLVQLGTGAESAAIVITSADMPRLNHHWQLSQIPESAELTDGALQVDLLQGDSNVRVYRKVYYVRPDIRFYPEPEFEEALEEWNSHPPASGHEFALELRRNGAQVEFWIDGRYFVNSALPPSVSNLTVTTSAEAEITSIVSFASPESERYLPLNLAVNPHQGAVQLRDLSLQENLSLNGIPISPWPLTKQIDVGLARWLRQDRDSMSFYDPYYKRSAWDNIAEHILFRIPRRFYNTAHILCAVDPDRSPTAAVRIGRYRQAWDGSGLSQADTNLRIDPTDSAGIRSIDRLGTVTLVKNGTKKSVPVYLVAVPLGTGEIADYLQWEGLPEDGGDWGERLDFLTLEFTRTMHERVTVSNGIFEKKPLGAESGIHIIGVTLEKSPVEIMIKSDEPGFSFYKNQNPNLTIETVNFQNRPVTLSLTAVVSDFEDSKRTVEQTVTANPGRHTTAFDLRPFELGWHQADFTFLDETGRTVWEQSLTFALLPPDTRQAKKDSPFGTWWFIGSHYTQPYADKVLPIIQKMGFRHVSPRRLNQSKSEKWGVVPEVFAKYQVTPSMMSTVRNGNIKKTVKEYFSLWPDTEFAMIFHETGLPGLGLELPPELTGGEPFKFTEKEHVDKVQELKEHIKTQAPAIRAAAPETKIMLGNGSTQFNVFWLREKLSREYFDCLGMEMAVQLFHPESQPSGWNLQSFWIAKRMAEIYGYEDLPIAACYEVDYRATAPGALALKRQAKWYTRDLLHCLAYELPSINVALIADCNSSYYTSRWGSAGVCGRSPLHMPKPSFVTLATLTRVLDRAEFVRAVDTGSTGLYCLEFRKGTSYIYASWAGRGKYPFVASLNTQEADAKITDSMGRVKSLPRNQKFQITATELPSYLETTARMTSISAGEPMHEEPDFNNTTVLAPMTDPQNWRVVQEKDTAFENYCAYKPMIKAEIELQTKEDALKASLRPQPDVPGIIGRYSILEPEQELQPIPSSADTIGVWVKGNSNWGRIYFEVEDAEGRRWTSNGWEEGPNSWDMSDWEAEAALNHDGWRFVHLPLPPPLYPSGYYRPVFRHWRCQGDNSKDNEPTYPLRFKRLYLVMREQVVYVNSMVPAKSLSIELKGLTATESKP